MSQAISEPPVLFMLHGLGGSGRAWGGIAAALGADFECIAIDLPGFGDAPAASTAGVAATVGHVEQRIRARGAVRWMLVGHSMGGKIASLVAARALAGEAGSFGLAGIVLLAGSPPSPEPIDEDVRREMIGWVADGPLDAAAAREFIDANIGAPLPAELDALAIDDLRRCHPQAWRAWLETGAREDRSAEVGRLDLPALILAGGEDAEKLGIEGQRATNAKVYPRARIEVLDGAGHLLPLERPQAVAEAIRRFWHDDAGKAPATPAAHAEVIASDRVNRRMRSALARRALADDPDFTTTVLSPRQLSTLRAVAACVVPQPEPTIDLAARVAAQLARGEGDGWRFAELPADAVAYGRALDALGDFADVAADEQDSRLAAIAGGGFVPDPAGAADESFSAAQMKLWFQDACSDLAHVWVAHPATLARIGFDGYANGGDVERLQGYTLLAADAREAWEPSDSTPQGATA